MFNQTRKYIISNRQSINQSIVTNVREITILIVGCSIYLTNCSGWLINNSLNCEVGALQSLEPTNSGRLL